MGRYTTADIIFLVYLAVISGLAGFFVWSDWRITLVLVLVVVASLVLRKYIERRRKK